MAKFLMVTNGSDDALKIFYTGGKKYEITGSN